MWYNSGFRILPESPMSRIIVVLLSLLALVVPSVLLALEPAEEFPAGWLCIVGVDSPDFTCFSVCSHYDGTRIIGDESWHCPNSSIQTRCTTTACVTPEQCARFGLRYTPCHDVEEWVCDARAVRETQFGCKVTGPPLSAVKNGDCVLRLVKNPRRNRLQLRNDCWNPSDYQFAPEGWVPVHPETLQP